MRALLKEIEDESVDLDAEVMIYDELYGKFEPMTGFGYNRVEKQLKLNTL